MMGKGLVVKWVTTSESQLLHIFLVSIINLNKVYWKVICVQVFGEGMLSWTWSVVYALGLGLYNTTTIQDYKRDKITAKHELNLS